MSHQRVYPFDKVNHYVLVLINSYVDPWKNPTTKYMMVFPSYKTWTNLKEINEYAKRFLLKIDFENAIDDIQYGKIELFETKLSADNKSWNVYRLDGNDEIVKDEN